MNVNPLAMNLDYIAVSVKTTQLFTAQLLYSIITFIHFHNSFTQLQFTLISGEKLVVLNMEVGYLVNMSASCLFDRCYKLSIFRHCLTS